MVALLQRASVFHNITPFPWLFIHLILNLTAIAKCAQLISSSNQNLRWFALQNKNKEEEEKQKKRQEDGSKDPAGVCAPQNGIPTVHSTALQWPHPSPSRSTSGQPAFFCVVLQPAIPGHQKHQTCTAELTQQLVTS